MQGQLNNQLQLSPVITLSADGHARAGALARLMQDGVFNQGANWGAGVYENEYVKQDGVWKIREAAPVRALLCALRGRLDPHHRGAERALSASPRPGPTGQPRTL